MLSIIIPTLNEQGYINRLLSSLENQTYKDFEVIIIDAKSTDRTKEEVQKFQKHLAIKIISSNKGVALQKNKGVKHASYETLLFLDADTYLGKDFLKKSLAYHKKGISIPLYIPSTKRKTLQLFFAGVNFLFYLTQRIKPCGVGVCIFSSKKLHHKVKGFDESLEWMEDVDYIKRIGVLKQIPTKIFVSTRRFEKEGTRKSMALWLRAYWYVLSGSRSSTRYF